MLFTIGFGMLCSALGGSVGLFQGLNYADKEKGNTKQTVESISEFLRKGKRDYA